MELLADRDPEEARKILDPVLERMMEAVHRYEGTVNQVMGDGIMALFGAPLAHEDHAVRACYAALRMQELVKKYAEEVRRSHAAVVRIRVGLNSGEVVVRAIGSDLHMDYTAVGQTTHLAARMEQLADPGAIVITPETLGLVEGYVEVKSLGPVPVKGLAEPVEVYEVTGAGPARTRLEATARRGLTRFVGRDGELEHLRRAQQLAANGHGQITAIVGEAGVGKSRLVYEFTHSHRLQGWVVLESASVSYGKATSYLPVIDLLKGYFKIQDRDDLRGIREKVTGKLLTLDRVLEPTLPALLSLLDVPVDDSAWQALDPPPHPARAGRRPLRGEARGGSPEGGRRALGRGARPVLRGRGDRAGGAHHALHRIRPVQRDRGRRTRLAGLSMYRANGQRVRRTGPVAVGGSRAVGSVTHSPDSPLFERHTGLGGPTALARTGATHGATRPVSVESRS
jgi:class 3 adenylate cyclase